MKIIVMIVQHVRKMNDVLKINLTNSLKQKGVKDPRDNKEKIKELAT